MLTWKKDTFWVSKKKKGCEQYNKNFKKYIFELQSKDFVEQSLANGRMSIRKPCMTLVRVKANSYDSLPWKP